MTSIKTTAENKDILTMTREQLIEDLSKTYCEHNDIESKSNEDLIRAWKKHGIHVGTWVWDEVEVNDSEREDTVT